MDRTCVNLVTATGCPNKTTSEEVGEATKEDSEQLPVHGKHGDLGLTSMEGTLDVMKVNRLVRYLSNPNKKVCDVAWNQLPAVVRKRKGTHSITDANLQEFLNTKPTRCEYRQGDIRNLWSTAQKFIESLGCELIFEGKWSQFTFELRKNFQ